MARCVHDLEPGNCADCRPWHGALPLPLATSGRPGSRDPGPWFPAGYGGDCSGCGQDIEPGDEIRADGSGGWERRDCCGENDEGAYAAGPAAAGYDRCHPSSGAFMREGRGTVPVACASDWDSGEVNAQIARTFETGEPWRSGAEADWDESRGC